MVVVVGSGDVVLIERGREYGWIVAMCLVGVMVVVGSSMFVLIERGRECGWIVAM